MPPRHAQTGDTPAQSTEPGTAVGDARTPVWQYDYGPDADVLRALPARACIAFGARCCRWGHYATDTAAYQEGRLGDHLALTKRNRPAVEDAIRTLEAFAAGDSGAADELSSLLNRLQTERGLDGVGAGVTGYAVHLTAMAAKLVYDDGPGRPWADLIQGAADVAGNAATGVPTYLVDSPLRDRVREGIYRDLEAVVAATAREGWDDSKPLSPSFFGPLADVPTRVDSRACVFCNCRPASKNNEDVIPNWLRLDLCQDKYLHGTIRLPGSRRAGRKIGSVKLPACVSCNSSYGRLLEGRASNVVRLLAAGASDLTEAQAASLLDWVDKVRVGLWRAALLRSGNPLRIAPRYAIAQRIGMQDRVLLIARAREGGAGYDMSTLEDPVFHILPCFCALLLNNLYLIGASRLALVSPYLGLPYPKDVRSREDGSTAGTVVRPQDLTPNRQWPFAFSGFSLFAQAVWPRPCVHSALFRGCWDRIMPDHKRSRIYCDDGKRLSQLSDSPTPVIACEFADSSELVAAGNRVFAQIREYMRRDELQIRSRRVPEPVSQRDAPPALG